MNSLNLYPRLSLGQQSALRLLTATSVATSLCIAPLQAATDLEALIAQTASTMASADYATKNCPNLKIDDTKLSDLVKRSGKTRAELRADEDYEDQVNALRGVEQSSGKTMVCSVLSSAHGGYGRDVIRGG